MGKTAVLAIGPIGGALRIIVDKEALLAIKDALIGLLERNRTKIQRASIAEVPEVCQDLAGLCAAWKEVHDLAECLD